jgi:hypothetical protein
VNLLDYISPVILVFFIFPILTIVISVILQLIIKRKLAVICIVFIAYLIATFVLFNSTFLIWCFVYAVISFLGTIIGDLIIKYSKKSA